MGYAARNAVALASSLEGLKVAVDVQHLYKPAPHAGDHGSVYTLATGLHVTEAQLATQYAGALVAWLRARGAAVLANDPARGVLVGEYPARNREAAAFGAAVYLACHVNAGGGDYCATEYMVGTPGQQLGNRIGLAVCATFPEVGHTKENALIRGQRGAVCVESCPRSIPALILEPFFGDTRRHQGIMAPPALKALGEAIGVAVGAWWADGHK